MSEYIDEKHKIKSVKGLTKHIRKRLEDKGIVDDSLECVKVDSYVYVFYAVGSILHKETLKAHVIYTILDKDVEKVIDNIVHCITHC